MTEYNKVVYDGQTLIDLTQDDVTASDVRNGVYFHSADGVRGQGTLVSTSTPTASTIAEFDSTAHMNSTDMSSQEIEDFIDSLSLHGKGEPTGYGTPVNITSYSSSSNMYTCPSNGVVRIQCTYRSNCYITLNNEDGEGLAQLSSTGSANMAENLLSSTPVFTGMKVYIVNNSTYNYAHFIPYTYD